MPTDTELLQDFIRQKSDQAFARIVARYSNLVYAAALRQVRDPGMAEDVTQSAFLVLARKAASVPEKRLAGWLLTTTRLCALDALKKQSRRTHYEREAAMAKSEISQSVEPHDPSVTVLLDEAMTRLRSRDCTALALRYLEDKPINDVAAAIGVTPHAAQKIVSRSLAKLRAILARKGVILSSTDVLALALLHQTAHTAPAGMVISLSSSKAASFSIAKGVTDMMFWTKVKLAAVIVATVVVAGGAGSIVAVRALAQTPVPTPNPPPSVKVVTIIPNDGAIDVDPATKQLRVTFNQPMDTRGYSFVEDGSDTYPGTAALPYWLDDTTCVLPIALKPDHDYWLSLNSDRFQNFRTVQGQPLPPDPIEFHTVAAVPATSP